MRTFVRSCPGFSLVETMVAVAILAAGVLSIARVFTASAAVLERDNRSTFSAILAAQKIEELRTPAARGGSLPLEGADRVDGRGAVHAGRGAAAGAGYTRRWSIRALPAHPDALRVVEVRVRPGQGPADDGPMSGGRRAAGEVTLTTIVARQDP